MASFVVLAPVEGDESGERTVFVRDGFAFLAFLVPVFWMLWHRLWLWAGLYLLVMAVTNVAMSSDGAFWPGLALSLAASLFAGIEAQNMRIEKLHGRGYETVAVIEADHVGDAEAIHFATRANPAGPPDATVAASPHVVPSDQRERRTSVPRDRRPSGSFGLFEWNERP